MIAEELCYAGIRELGGLFRRGALSPVDYATDLLGRIERLDKSLNAYVTVTAERALADARAAEAAIRRGDARSPRGHPDRLQGSLRDPGDPHHRGLGGPRRLGAGLRLHLRDPAPAGGHGDARQAHHPRVRLRHPVPRPPLPARAQPVERRSHPGRLEQRLGRGAGGRPHGGLARLRHRRLDPGPGRLLRHRRAQADLRPREPRGSGHALVDARSHRPHGPLGRGLRVHAAGAGRPRPGRPGLGARAGGRLPGRPRGRRQGAPGRRGARLLLRAGRAGDGGRLRAGPRRAGTARGRRSATSRSRASTPRRRSWSSCSPRPSPITSAICASTRSCTATCCGRSSWRADSSAPTSTCRPSGCGPRSARTPRARSSRWTS